MANSRAVNTLNCGFQDFNVGVLRAHEFPRMASRAVRVGSAIISR